MTPECVMASAAIIESMDSDVDPCEDFYGFVCNGWIDKHPIPKGTSFADRVTSTAQSFQSCESSIFFGMLKRG